MGVTFHLVLLGWLLFRVRPVGESGALEVAVDYLAALGSLVGAGFEAPPPAFGLLTLVVALDVMIVHTGTHFWVRGARWPVRGTVIAILVALGFVLDSGPNRAFIYFQF